MKKFLLLAYLLALSAGAGAVTCPGGYAPLADPNYVDGQGVGPDIPKNICYQYPYSGDYSKIGFYWTTNNPSTSMVLPNVPANDDQSYSSGLIVHNTALVTSHYVVFPWAAAGTQMQFAFSSCRSASSCPRTSPNWSSAPLGSQVSVYCLTSNCYLPTPSSGTTTWYSYIEGPPQIRQGHTVVAGSNGMWQSGVAPSGAAISLEVDGSPCAAALGGTTCNHIATQVSCTNGMSPNTATHDWATDVFQSGPYSGQYFCGNSPMGFEPQHPIITPDNSATIGAHTVTVKQQALDGSQNPLGALVTSTYTFNVIAVPTLASAPPSAYPPIPGLATWTYNIAGTANPANPLPGYLYEALQLLACQTTTPGTFFNDAVSAVEVDFGCYALGFYDMGRFPTEFGDILASCNAASPIACPAWSTGAKTQGQILNNGSGACFLDVVTAGASAGSAPSCPAVGSTVTDGSATEMNIGTSTWWYDLAQNMGDQYRNSMLLGQQWLPAREWGIFPIALEKFAFRRNPSPTNTPDANSVQYFLGTFITGNGAQLLNKLQYDGWTPLDTVRAMPQDGLAISMWRYLSGAPVVDAAGVNLEDRWVDLALQDIDELTSCTVTGNIGAGYPNCAPGVQLSAQNFDWALVLEQLREECIVMGQSACQASPIPAAIAELIDWLNTQQFQPDVALIPSYYSQPYSSFGVPVTPANVDFAQSELNNMAAPTMAWLGKYCGNCTLPLSGVPVWTVADQYFSHAYDNVSLSPKQYGQLFYGLSSYVHWRTAPGSGGWTTYQSSATPALNPYSPAWPNLLGPYPQMSYPAQPIYTPGGSGAGSWAWWSAPAVSSYICYAIAPADPHSCANKVTVSSAQTLCNPQANQCLNTVGFTGLASDVYNIAFGGTDAAGNTSPASEANWNLNGACCYQMTVSGSSLTITGTLGDGNQGVGYSSTLGASNGTPPYRFTTTFCLGAACTGTNVAGLTMSAAGVYSGTPTKSGAATVSVTVMDSASNHAAMPFSLSIAPTPNAGGFRGEFRGLMR